jgi:hypothetical protein
VAGEDDLGAVADEVLDGGDGSANTGVVGDVLVVVERHVEVRAHQDALPLELGGAEVPHALLGHGGHGPGPARGRCLATPRSDVDREPRVAGGERQRPRRLARCREPPAPQRGGDRGSGPGSRAGRDGDRGGRCGRGCHRDSEGGAGGRWLQWGLGRSDAGGREEGGLEGRKRDGLCGREEGRGICLSLARGRDDGSDGCVGEAAPVITRKATFEGFVASISPCPFV